MNKRTFSVRIGKVHYKGERPFTLILRPSLAQEAAERCQRTLDASADHMRKYYKNARGVVIVMWDAEGGRNVYFNMSRFDNPVPISLSPSYVKDVLLMELSSNVEQEKGPSMQKLPR